MAKLIGNKPDQVPTNGDLGTLAFQDSDNVIVENLTVSGSSSKLVVEDNSTDAALRVTQTGTGNALVVEDEANPDSTPFVVDSVGRLLTGTTSARATFSGGLGAAKVQQEGTGLGAWHSITELTDNNGGPVIGFAKNRSATNTVVQNNDDIGTILFQGNDGTNFQIGAWIKAHVDGTPSTSDMPGRLVFSTTADGAGSPTERMRIDSSGVVSVNTGYITLNNNKVGGIQVTIADDAYAEITPPRVGAHFMAITEDDDGAYPNSGCFGFVYTDFGDSPVVTEVSVGSSFETSISGPPTGTTGNDVHATLFVGGTSGKIYLENRLGVTGVFQITFL